MTPPHRLVIRLQRYGNKVFAVPQWQRIDVITGPPDSIAEGNTEEDCLKAVEDWIAEIPIYPVPKPVHPKRPRRPR